MTTERVLVAGIGNIFFGDDGFGVAVADRLAGRASPDGVTIADYGIRGVHLAFELLDGYDMLVLVDALRDGRGARHGRAVRARAARSPRASTRSDAPTMSPAVVLATLAGSADRSAGCSWSAASPRPIEGGIGLSGVVAAAVEPAAAMVGEILMTRCHMTGNEEEADR